MQSEINKINGKKKGSIDSNDQISILIFEVGWEQFTMELFEASEIIKRGQIRRLPKSLPYIEGIYNHRGEIIHILNLKKRLRLNEYLIYKTKLESINKSDNDSKSLNNFIIIVEINNKKIGFLVDRIVDVVNVNSEDIIDLSPIFQTSIDIEYIKSIIKFDDRPRVMLNIIKLLTEVGKNIREEETTLKNK